MPNNFVALVGLPLDWCAKVGVGFQRRLADIRAAERYQRERYVELVVKRGQEALRSDTQPAAFFQEVGDFLAFFDGRPRHRCPIWAIIPLVLTGFANRKESRHYRQARVVLDTFHGGFLHISGIGLDNLRVSFGESVWGAPPVTTSSPASPPV